MAASGRPLSEAKLVRIEGRGDAWKMEMVADTGLDLRFKLDGRGHVLYPCRGGYCEVSLKDVEDWHRNDVLPIQRSGSFVQAHVITALRDHQNCVWTRTLERTFLKCPGDVAAKALPYSVASTGTADILELSDGSICLPSYGFLTIGRPGHFRTVTMANGYPSFGASLATRDGSIWLSSANGLFVFPSRTRLEFWTQREGLTGNTWSVLPMGHEVFAVSGDRVQKLDNDRSRWRPIAEFGGASHLAPGPSETLFVSSRTEGVAQMTKAGRILKRSAAAYVTLLSRTAGGEILAEGNGNFRVQISGSTLSLERVEKSYRLGLASQEPVDPNAPGGSDPNFLGVDGMGHIWRGTSNGVYVASPEQARQRKWLFMGLSDGLPAVDTNQRSFMTDANGSIWFGMDSSVIHISPAKDLTHPGYAPPVFVSGFSRNGGEFQMADRAEKIKSGDTLAAHLGSLQMDRRSTLQFRYRLWPEQTEWKPEKKVDIAIGKLHWGAHTLEVQARLGDGPWSASAVQSFTVLKPLWLSLPALLGFVFAGGVGVAGVQRWRKKLRRRAETPLPGLAEWRASVLSPELRNLQGAILDGRFEVGRMVARGGFATVWEGLDRKQGRCACAVKVFRHELLDKSWMAKRFQQEVSALTQVKHPNVVRICGHGTAASGAPYLAMEFIHGKTLRDELKTSKLSWAQTASYLRQIANALEEIHSHGVCHRDLKPENLMIRAGAAPGTELVLIDFSIAIVQDADETMHGLSRAAGTLHYMAPEQAIGYADESSDIYSLAKILIEMLTGERLSTLLPNASIDLPARVRQLLSDTKCGLSSGSIALIARALEFDPSKRPNQANEFGAQIAQDLDSEIRREMRARDNSEE